MSVVWRVKENQKLQSRPVTAIIFDYDDTLFPTSFLSHWGKPDLYDIPAHGQAPDLHAFAQEKEIHLLEKYTFKVLQKAHTYTDNVFIVTNGNAWWIDDSLTKCMPRGRFLLQRNHNL